MKNNTSKQRVIAVIAFLGGLSILPVLFLGQVAAIEESAVVVADIPTVYLSTTTVPLFVTGVVAAADRTVVYAKTAGVVSNVMAAEGSIVTKGQVLAVQSTPVAVAEYALATANSELSALERSLASGVQEKAVGKAKITARTAAEVAAVRAVADDTRVQEVLAALGTELQSSVLTVIEAIDFVNKHRSLFSAEGLQIYDEVTTNFYGSVPNYFQGGVMRPVSSSVDLKVLLETARSESDNVFISQDVATLLLAELDSLTMLYETGEADVFARNQNIAIETIEVYLAKRAAVLATQRSLNATVARFREQLDVVMVNNVVQPSEVAITTLDEAIAAEQAMYVKRIEAQSAVVASAREAVTAASLSLGRPTAPFAGTVANVLVDEGQYVTAGTPLLTLVGDGARELTITVPIALASSVEIGQKYLVDGVVAGYVDRVSQVAEGGGVVAIITLDGESSPRVGSTVAGRLMLDAVDRVFMIPRAYLHFDASGPYVRYESSVNSRVHILYDGGAFVYVEVAEVLDVALVPSVSITL